MLTIIFGIGFFTSSCVLLLSLKKNFDFMEKLDEIEEVVQNSVDIIEEQYRSMDQKTKIEVFSDEPVVRSLVQDISVARDAVLAVAKMLDSTFSYENSEENSEIKE